MLIQSSRDDKEGEHMRILAPILCSLRISAMKLFEDELLHY